VRWFRVMLKDIAKWADRDDNLSEFAQRANWWEAYWYEREYGDSQFDDILISDFEKEEAMRRKFYRLYIPLSSSIIDLKALQNEIVQSAIVDDPTLPAISFLFDSCDWLSLQYLLDNVHKIMHETLLTVIEDAIQEVPLAKISKSFIRFLIYNRRMAKLGWSDAPRRLTLTMVRTRSTIVSNGRLGRAASHWIQRKIVSNEDDTYIANESRAPLGQLLTTLHAKAA
jgi:hypothetical protein